MATALRFIKVGVLRLSTIIDALLRLSRAGRVVYHWQAIEVQKLVTRVVDSLHNTITARAITVTVADDLPPAWGDPSSIEQLFDNLVGNAVKYIEPSRPGVITIGSLPAQDTDTEGASRFSTYYVRDNGLGIPERVRPKLFQLFQRFHPDAAPGDGIGLSLVQRIAARHGGTVWVTSVVGEGSTFFVRLPACVEAQPLVAATIEEG